MNAIGPLDGNIYAIAGTLGTTYDWSMGIKQMRPEIKECA